MRIERDMLGERSIENECLYGIHTLRASENFNVSKKGVNKELILALIEIKKAAAMANIQLKLIDKSVGEAIVDACNQFKNESSKLWSSMVTDAYQGGAGTSTNMNVNEVIANLAIDILKGRRGDYSLVHPLHHVNQFQSTNDVYPTAMRIAAIRMTRRLADELSKLQSALQIKETDFCNILKLGRTQLMDALPITVGQEFGAWARAISRDRWRIYKVEERLREINIGGTAIGTGMNAPLEYIYLVTELLQHNTGLGLCRSDFPIDNTQNMDVFVEVSGLLKALAVNLMKISGDLRLLASGPNGGIGELILPKMQAGSSIMPNKVNPVIPEMVMQVAMRVIANDSCITHAAAYGQLELNAFAPLIAETLLESYELLINAIPIFRTRCIDEIKVDLEACKRHIESSTSMVTALLYHLGYEKCNEIAENAQAEGKPIRQIVLQEEILDEEQLNKVMNVYAITSPGIPGKERL